MTREDLYNLNPEITKGKTIFAFEHELTHAEYQHIITSLREQLSHKEDEFLVIGNKVGVIQTKTSSRLRTIVDTHGWEGAQVDYPEVARLLKHVKENN